MTISSTTTRVQYNGNGATTAFAVPFEYLLASGVKVIYTDADGVDATWVKDTHYTLSDNTAATTGTVNVKTTPTDYTPASGTTITILRNQPLTQGQSYTEDDPFPAKSHEKALDRLEMQIQMLEERADRVPTLKETSTNSGLTLPEPSADKLIGWNAGATDLENKTVSLLGSIEVLDEDDMASDSATKVPSQQSVKAYADTKQPLDADLTAIAALAKTDGNIVVSDGATWVAESGATARTSLGLGSAAVLDAGTASGNLKVLNADGGFSFNLTAAPTVDIDSQSFGGTWKAHHYFKAVTTGAHAGTGRFAFGVEHVAEGSTGASGATNLDGCFWFEVGKSDWNSDQSIQGPVTVGFVNGTNNAWSDLGGIVVNLSKPMTATPGTFGSGGVDGNGSIVAWESTSRAYNMAGTAIMRDIHCLIGWDAVYLPGSVLNAGQATGFHVEATKGIAFSAFSANDSNEDTATVTMTIASPGVVTYTAHGLAEDTPIVFTTTGALPTGITSGTTYYVSRTNLATDTFEVSSSVGGASINTSGSQSGTHTCTVQKPEFDYLLVHSTNRNAANIDFAITSTNKAEGPGLVWAGAGTEANPTFSFMSDPDTGMFISAANTLAFATNGIRRLTVDAATTRSISTIYAHSSTAIPAGGTAGAGFRFSSTSNFGVFFGSGAPTLAAAKGSFYLRSDGSTTNDRAYINTDGSTTWTAVATAA